MKLDFFVVIYHEYIQIAKTELLYWQSNKLQVS